MQHWVSLCVSVSFKNLRAFDLRAADRLSTPPQRQYFFKIERRKKEGAHVSYAPSHWTVHLEPGSLLVEYAIFSMPF